MQLRIITSLMAIASLLPSQLMAQNNALSKHVNIQYSGPKFQSVLNLFTQATGYTFAYANNIVASEKMHNVHYKNIRADKALRDFLHQNGLEFEVASTTIILKKWQTAETINQYTITGRVVQSQTGERLVKATVQIPTLNLSTLTDEFGMFRIILPKIFAPTSTRLVVFFFYPGHDLFSDTLSNDKNYFITANLQPTIERIQTTLIQTNKMANRLAVIQGQSDQFCISSTKLQQMPSLLGEADVMRALSMNPGVVSGSEGMLGMYVRGGAADQNLVLLDDVPVFNAYHLYGIFGVFNGDIVKSAQLNRGSFSAEHGGRLSSVTSVQSVDGNENKWSANVSVGALTSKMMFQGPLWEKRTTLTIAFRRSNFDLLTQTIANAVFENSNNINRYNFWDVNAKINHQFSAKSNLSFSIYAGGDRASFVDRRNSELDNASFSQKREQGNKWGNQLGSLKWQYQHNKKVRFTAKTFVTDYSFTQQNDYSYRVKSNTDITQNKNSYTNYSLTNGLRDMAIDGKFDIQLSPKLSLKFGGGYIYHTFTPGDRSLKTQIDSVERVYRFNDSKINTPEVFSFATLTLNHPELGQLDLGSRISYFGLEDNQFYIRPEPRLSYRKKINTQMWVKVAASQNVQFYHQLNNLAMGLPSDLWVPSNAKFAPSQANQISLGFTYTLPRYQWSLEYFEKSFKNLLEYRDNAVYVTNALNWEKTVTQGTGAANGLECLIEKRVGKLTGWASYTLMYNTRQFDELNHGNAFPSRYDRRHNFYIVGIYRLSQKISLSGSWIFNSGFAYTLPIGIYQSPTADNPFAEIYIYGDRNNARTRSNHRLDISAQYINKHKHFSETWSLGFYNLYNRQNPFFISVEYNAQGQRRLTQLSLLPILPHLNYQISF